MWDNVDAKKTEEEIGKGTNEFNKKMSDIMSNLGKALDDFTPKGVTKKVELKLAEDTEVVIREGFFGFFRKTKIVKAETIVATVYISMNNIICMDIADKTEMRKYFDHLK